MAQSGGASKELCVRLIVRTLAAAFFFATPLTAQSSEALQQMAEGWGRGVWTELRTLGLNPETGRFEPAEDSPYARWEVRVVAPGTIRYTTAHGDRREVQFLDGLYREGDVLADGSVAHFDEAQIVEHTIHGRENWRLLILWPAPPGSRPEERASSEIEVVGDLFIWTQWRGPLEGERTREVYSISQLEGDGTGGLP
jgi:hypothetical protein